MEGLVMSVGKIEQTFWQDKRVLLTGHTGFKGAWLSLVLSRLGARVTGLALDPPTTPNLFQLAQIQDSLDAHFVIDVNDLEEVRLKVIHSNPEIVLHLAAQSLVRRSYRDPIQTFSTNVFGTINLLHVVRQFEPRVVLVATTDKVYAQNEEGLPFRETDPLGGHDPYSASKAACEIAVDSFRRSFFATPRTRIASARAGNVIGGGDWAEDRLIPDAIRSWAGRKPLEVRRPNAIRPWQHVLDCLAGYLLLVQHLWSTDAESGAFNFGPDPNEAITVEQTIEIARSLWGAYSEVIYADAPEGPHEASTLILDSAKARGHLGFRPRWQTSEAVARTIGWYQSFYAGADPRNLCASDIAEHGMFS